jgi:hypothetical protein
METLILLRRDFPGRLLTRLRDAARSLKPFASTLSPLSFALLALGITSKCSPR